MSDRQTPWKIRTEYHPINPPKPIGVVIFDAAGHFVCSFGIDNKATAELIVECVNAAQKESK